MAHDVQVKAQPGGIDGQELFTRLLLASSDGTDLAEFSTESLADHADVAVSFIADKPKGQYKVRTRASLLGQGNARTPATLIEILNDDMPFLVDSIMGEIQARGIRTRLVLHPIFKTRRSATGALQAITAAGDRAWGDGTQESYISVHVDPLSETAARELVAALSQILDGLRIAVADWVPMLERVRKATRDLEANPPDIPADLNAESIAFLNWLVAGNFTLLGTRDFLPAGRRSSGRVDSCRGRRLWPAARSNHAGAAPRHRTRSHDARGAAFLFRAGLAHYHQVECRESYPPSRAHGLHRRQALRRRQASGR